MPDEMDRVQAHTEALQAEALRRHQAQAGCRVGRTHCRHPDCCEPIRPERTALGAVECDECAEETARRNAQFAAWARR